MEKPKPVLACQWDGTADGGKELQSFLRDNDHMGEVVFHARFTDGDEVHTWLSVEGGRHVVFAERIWKDMVVVLDGFSADLMHKDEFNKRYAPKED